MEAYIKLIVEDGVLNKGEKTSERSAFVPPIHSSQTVQTFLLC